MSNQLVLVRGNKVFVSCKSGDFVGMVKHSDVDFLVLQQASRIVTSDVERFLVTSDTPIIHYFQDDVQIPIRDCRFATMFKHLLPKRKDLVFPDAERLLGALGAVVEGQDG